MVSKRWQRLPILSSLIAGALVISTLGALRCSSDDREYGTVELGQTCASDVDCKSGICERLADGSGSLVCSKIACNECEGLDDDDECVSMPDGLESATCAGDCSTSYANPTGKRVCCAATCVCTAAGSCQ